MFLKGVSNTILSSPQPLEVEPESSSPGASVNLTGYALAMAISSLSISGYKQKCFFLEQKDRKAGLFQGSDSKNISKEMFNYLL